MPMTRGPILIPKLCPIWDKVWEFSKFSVYVDMALLTLWVETHYTSPTSSGSSRFNGFSPREQGRS